MHLVRHARVQDDRVEWPVRHTGWNALCLSRGQGLPAARVQSRTKRVRLAATIEAVAGLLQPFVSAGCWLFSDKLQTLSEAVPKTTVRMAQLGPHHIMAVYVEPLGLGPPKSVARLCEELPGPGSFDLSGCVEPQTQTLTSLNLKPLSRKPLNS